MKPEFTSISCAPYSAYNTIKEGISYMNILKAPDHGRRP